MSDAVFLRYRWRPTWKRKDEGQIGMDEDFRFGRLSRAPADAVAGMRSAQDGIAI